MTVKDENDAHLKTGRVNQKLRTRDALVATAAALVGRGASFTVAEVADLARIGRTTAYRYFPTQEMLLAHATLWKLAHIESEDFKKILEHKTSPTERLRAVVSGSDESTTAYDREYRTMLRLSLDPDPASQARFPKRGAVRRERLASAVQGAAATLGPERFDRLVAALCLFVGIEAAVVLQDICLLTSEEARAVKLWASGVLLRGAIDEAKRTGRGAAPDSQ
jgi:AcrR family transcriptional regulator